MYCHVIYHKGFRIIDEIRSCPGQKMDIAVSDGMVRLYRCDTRLPIDPQFDTIHRFTNIVVYGANDLIALELHEDEEQETDCEKEGMG